MKIPEGLWYNLAAFIVMGGFCLIVSMLSSCEKTRFEMNRDAHMHSEGFGPKPDWKITPEAQP